MDEGELCVQRPAWILSFDLEISVALRHSELLPRSVSWLDLHTYLEEEKAAARDQPKPKPKPKPKQTTLCLPRGLEASTRLGRLGSVAPTTTPQVLAPNLFRQETTSNGASS